jgi:nucleotide-binding universal stress UspA family protein
MFKRILVPVDGSSVSRAGLQQALRLARDQKAQLRIVHIVDEAVLAQYPEAIDGAGELMSTMIDDGKKTLNKALLLARRHKIKADSVLHEKLLGSLADLILDEAKKWRADIIVLGTSTQSGLKRFFVGSDAEAIVRASRLPVLLIHGNGSSSARKRASSVKRKSGVPRTERTVRSGVARLRPR